MSKELQNKVRQFPEKPGIYLMKDCRGKVIYVGKATNLNKRVRSYFQGAHDHSRLITRRIEEVVDIDIVLAGSEKEAFLLENNFIKQFRPKYNVLFRDDKSFASIKIPLKEPYPRPVLTRRVKDRSASYFGPYANSRAARETLDLLHDIFPLRKCTLRQFRHASRPCLYGQMEKCLAPCCREISRDHYNELLKEVEMFLKGKSNDLLELMRKEMKEAAAEHDFEAAAEFRDRIRAVEQTVEKQLASSTMDRADRDVFGFFATDKRLWISVLFIRNGVMQDAASYNFSAGLDSSDAILRSFSGQFYSGGRSVPDEVLLPVDTGEIDLLAQWLTAEKGRKVRVLRPERGRKKKLVQMAESNAAEAQKVNTRDSEKRRLEMESLRAMLSLEALPLHIECFDISNLSGREAAGSMVVFKGGEPDKSSYRRYRIKGVEGQDDFAMMHEVITRRYRHAVEDAGSDRMSKMPDMIVVDGGPGQLEAAFKALEALQVPKPDLIALAKARSEGGRNLKKERVFVPERKEALELEENTYAFKLLTRIRDEAHRFALRYHRKLRRQATMKSPLEEIPGIGRKMAERILDHFKSLDRVKQADVDQLCQIKGVSRSRAQTIYRCLRGKSGEKK